ncbi:hypothetical protein ABI59_04545 [Acidobacteria bacterium Mor1]|nr:hypothetical protein ABI59_04545 [Acidobacteria bacterium Mor1]
MRRALILLITLLLVAATNAAAKEPLWGPLSIVDAGGPLDDPEVEKHLAFSASIFDAVRIPAVEAGDWRTGEIHKGLRSFIKRRRREGMEVIVAISPWSEQVAYSDKSTAEQLARFLRKLRKRGVKRAILDFSRAPDRLVDLEDALRFGTRSELAQIALANEVASARTGIQLWLHPSASTVEVLAAQPAYIPPIDKTRDSERSLAPGIGVVTVGMDLTGRTIPSAPLTELRNHWDGRPLMLRDGFPRSDNSREEGLALLLGPLKGREPLGATLSAYSCPVQSELAANRLTLETIGNYLDRDTAYDAEASRKRAVHRLAGEDRAVRAALDAQSLEWGGFIGELNYRPAEADNVDAAVRLLRSPAERIGWDYVRRRYPERIEALRRAEDQEFAAVVIRRMQSRLAIARALPLVDTLRSAGNEQERSAALQAIDALRRKTGAEEARRLLDLFLERAGVPAK